jgi:nucleotide-binding universal stress UspA family protein
MNAMNEIQSNEANIREVETSRIYPYKPEPRVLLATHFNEDSIDALQRAEQLTQILQGDLLVLTVLPVHSAQPVTPNDTKEAIQSLRAARGAFQVARAICRNYLNYEVPEDNIIVRQGEFLTAVSDVALMYNVDLIVLPPSEGADGARLTRLTQKTQVPVLIARPPGHSETIVAASDLENTDCPIVKRANHLSQKLSAPMVLVHNMQPTVRLPEPSALAIAYDEIRVAREMHVKETTESLAPNADTVVVNSLSTADAILRVAQEKGADLIVVGAYRRSWAARLFSSGVAAQVAERANHSVLITPLE